MSLEPAGPTTNELYAIVQRLATDLSRESLDRSELLQIEITLRGMIPTLEGMLQYAIYSRGQYEGAAGADETLMTLSMNLQWIQLNARAPLDRIRLRLDESVRCAELVLQHLAG